MRILVTGGAGFIGSNFIRYLLRESDHTVVNVDKLTYASNPVALADFERQSRYSFHQCDIVDSIALSDIFSNERPEVVVHLAAESHVDRSIDAPSEFIQTNLVGTFNLLNCARRQFEMLSSAEKARFRFLHVSTDEVFGSLTGDEKAVNEAAVYAPSSPYSASKAGSDHLAMAWNVTYGLPVIVTHAANNYGAYQHREKLIPTIIANAIQNRPIPIYGDGQNVRDWLFVEDHCRALECVLSEGVPGQTYNVGAENEHSNLAVVDKICAVLDELLNPEESHSSLIRFVDDRKGHDFRYALDTSKLRSELNWSPATDWEVGIRRTVEWYLENRDWLFAANQRNNPAAPDLSTG